MRCALPSVRHQYTSISSHKSRRAHTHATAWSKLGLQSLVTSGMYDPTASQRMWGARFDRFAYGFAARNPAAVARLRAGGTHIGDVIKEHVSRRWKADAEVSAFFRNPPKPRMPLLLNANVYGWILRTHLLENIMSFKVRKVNIEDLREEGPQGKPSARKIRASVAMGMAE